MSGSPFDEPLPILPEVGAGEAKGPPAYVAVVRARVDNVRAKIGINSPWAYLGPRPIAAGLGLVGALLALAGVAAMIAFATAFGLVVLGASVATFLGWQWRKSVTDELDSQVAAWGVQQFDRGVAEGKRLVEPEIRQREFAAAAPTDINARIDYVAIDSDGEVLVRLVLVNAGRATWRIDAVWLSSFWSDTPRIALRGGKRAQMPARELKGVAKTLAPTAVLRLTFRGRVAGTKALQPGMWIHGNCGVAGAAAAPAGGITLKKLGPTGEVVEVPDVPLETLNGGAAFGWTAAVTHDQAGRVQP